MSDAEPAEEPTGCCEEATVTHGPTDEAAQVDGQRRSDDNAALESDENWVEVLDRLISRAMAQGDEALDELCAYLEQRSRGRRARPSHDLLPGWSRTTSRSSMPYRGRGRDEVCSELRRRQRSHHGLLPRPRGAERPPRNRRMSG